MTDSETPTLAIPKGNAETSIKHPDSSPLRVLSWAVFHKAAFSVLREKLFHIDELEKGSAYSCGITEYASICGQPWTVFKVPGIVDNYNISEGCTDDLR